MFDISFNELTIIIAILAIIISYYGIISKKPRVFFKIDPIYKNGRWHLNLIVLNCGDKPAFKIKIRTTSNLEKYIYEDLEWAKSMQDSFSNESNDKFRNILIREIKEFSRKRQSKKYYKDIENFNNYEKIRKESLSDLESCFSQTIQFISGGDMSSIYIGSLSKGSGSSNYGYLKTGFNVNANIEFYEEFRLEFFINFLMKLTFLSFFYCYVFSINIMNFYGIYPKIYEDSQFNKLKDKMMFINFFDFFKLDVKNGNILIKHNYDYSSKIDESYQYKEVDTEIVDEIRDVAKEIKLNNSDLFFKSHLYLVWESLLTDAELLIFDLYKMKYLNNYRNYISLYSILYDEECPEDIKLNNSFKEKYIKFIHIMYISNLLNLENKSNIEIIAFDYKEKGIVFDCFNGIYSSINRQRENYRFIKLIKN